MEGVILPRIKVERERLGEELQLGVVADVVQGDGHSTRRVRKVINANARTPMVSEAPRAGSAKTSRADIQTKREGPIGWRFRFYAGGFILSTRGRDHAGANQQAEDGEV